MKFKIENMTCGHCVKHITQAIQAADTTAQVNVDLSDKTVTVQSTLQQQKILDLLKEEDYQAQIID